jgi:energy-coupling factor transporter ATP-binding protein EcfA2
MCATGDFLKKYTYKDDIKVPTSILPMDILCDKGIAKGGCLAIASPPGGGKSTLLLQICRLRAESGLYSVYFDVERGVSTEQIDSAGLRKYVTPLPNEEWERVKIIRDVYSYADFQTGVRDIINAKKEGLINYDFLIVDSVNALTAKAILEGNCEDHVIAGDAKPASKLIKSIRGPLGAAGITFFNVVQAAVNIGGGMWDVDWVAKLCKAYEHAVDTLFIIEHPQYNKYKIYKKIKTPNGEVDTEIGYLGKLYTTKSRVGLNRIKLEVPMIAGVGCDNVQYLEKTLLTTGVFTCRGETYKYHDSKGEEQKIKGEQEYKNFVKDNYDKLVQMLWNLGFFDLSNKNTIDKVAKVESMTQAEIDAIEPEDKKDEEPKNDTEFI